MTSTHHNSSHRSPSHNQTPRSKGGFGRLGQTILDRLTLVKKIETIGSRAHLNEVKSEIAVTLNRRGVVAPLVPYTAELDSAGDNKIALIVDGPRRRALTHIIIDRHEVFGVVASSRYTNRDGEHIKPRVAVVLLPFGDHQEDSLGHHRTPRKLVAEEVYRLSREAYNQKTGFNLGAGFNMYLSDRGRMDITTTRRTTDPTYVLDYETLAQISAGGPSASGDLAILLNSDTNLWNPDLTGVDLNR